MEQSRGRQVERDRLPPPPDRAAGWKLDPRDRRYLRYWDGRSWTDAVAPAAPGGAAVAAPPGWYGDPADPSLQRFWDGQRWTDQTRPAATQRRGPPPPSEHPFEGPAWPAWSGPLAFIAAAIGGLLAALPLILSNERDPLWWIGSTFGQELLFVLLALAVAARSARPRPWHFGLAGTTPRQLATWLAVAVGGYSVFILPALLASGETDRREVLPELAGRSDAAALWLLAALIVVTAPITEEFFFRGFFYRALRNQLEFAPAVLANGLVFGLAHLPSEPGAFVPLTLFGALLCIVYERTGSILPAIAIHSLNNTIVLAFPAHLPVQAVALGLPVILGSLLLSLTLRDTPMRERDRSYG